MDPIRIAVIGTGAMARSHVGKFRACPGVEVVACCDISAKTAKAFATSSNIPNWYTDYRKLLASEEIDAVTVVASDAAHCEISVAALQKGLHVLCEKPLAKSVAEANRMVRAAAKAAKVNMVNFSYREMPALQEAHELVASGALGRVMHVEASYLQCWLANDAWGDWRKTPRFLWRMSKEHGGGALADIGCHILDFVQYAAGDISSVFSKAKSFDKGVRNNTCKGYKLDADDGFIATVEFAGGGIGTIQASRWATGHLNTLRLRIFGEKGSLVIDTDKGNDKLQLCVDDYHTRNALWNTIDCSTPHVTNQERFINSIRNGCCEAPTFQDGARIQAVLDAAGRSASTGKTISVKA